MSDRSRLLEEASLYLCTPLRDDLVEFVSECLVGGVDIVQLREKDAEGGATLASARRLAELCHSMGKLFFVNDRPDIAVLSGADGVHLGQGDIPPQAVRDLFGDSLLIGHSTHATAELTDALGKPVDYISVGPVVPTPTKPGRSGTGLEYVRSAAAATSIPFFVTGGVTPDSVAELMAAGASRFVVVRYLTDSSNPRDDARSLKDAIERRGTSRPSGTR